MVERIRCPRCGAINYGDVKKCWNCGAPLTVTPGAPLPTAPPPPAQEEISTKIPRIKYPILYPIGTVILIIGVVLAIFLLYAVTDTPQEIRKNYDKEQAVYSYQDFPTTVLGRITAVSNEKDGYGYYMYELNGDGEIKERIVSDSISPDNDFIVRSKNPDLAKTGDIVMWEVNKKSNDLGQDYLVVSKEKKPSLYRVPGIAIAVIGAALVLIGYVGIPDRSMKELIQGVGSTAPPLLTPATSYLPPQGQAPPGAYPPQVREETSQEPSTEENIEEAIPEAVPQEKTGS